MKKLTLEQCNALPLEELFIATIQEEIDFEDSQKSGEAKSKIQSGIKQMVADEKAAMQSNISNENENMIAELVTKMVFAFGANTSRTTVVWKLPDGTYLSLNGYGNGIYKEEDLKYIEPLGTYCKKGQFRFLEGLKTKETDDDSTDGIFIDVDSLDGINAYEKKVREAEGGSWF